VCASALDYPVGATNTLTALYITNTTCKALNMTGPNNRAQCNVAPGVLKCADGTVIIMASTSCDVPTPIPPDNTPLFFASVTFIAPSLAPPVPFNVNRSISCAFNGLYLPPPPPSPPRPSSWPGPFVCCSGQASCGGAVNDPAVCNALGDLYYATNGSGWSNRGGWASAAAGNATDYCGFFGTLCSGGMLQQLCVCGLFVGDVAPDSPRAPPHTQRSLQQQPERHHPVVAGQPDESAVSVRQRAGRARRRRLTRRALRCVRSALSINILSGTIPSSLGSLTSLQYLCVSARAARGGGA